MQNPDVLLVGKNKGNGITPSFTLQLWPRGHNWNFGAPKFERKTLMARGTNNRQKNISRVLRERKQNLSAKFYGGKAQPQPQKMKGYGSP